MKHFSRHCPLTVASLLIFCLIALILPVSAADGVNITEAFPDENFRRHVKINIDRNHDGYLDGDEILAVTSINVNHEQITSLQGVELFPNLKSLICNSNELTELDLRCNPALERLECFGNQLTALDLSRNSALQILVCYDNQLSALDVSHSPALQYLHCYNNRLAVLDVSQNLALISLGCHHNRLTALDLSKNLALTRLECHNNNLLALKLGTDQDIYGVQTILSLTDVGATLDLADFSIEPERMMHLIGGTLNGTVVTFTNPTAPFFAYTYDCGFGRTMSVTMAVNVAMDAAIPDENFRAYLSQNFDSNQDGYLSVNDRMRTEPMDVSGEQLTSLQGVELFPMIQSLNCSYNLLTELDLRQNTELDSLNCSYNLLTELDLRRNTKLEDIYCSENRLTALDLSHQTKLDRLYADGNSLFALELGAKPTSGAIGSTVLSFDEIDTTLDPTAFPGCTIFSPEKVSELVGGTLHGTTFTLTPAVVPSLRYTYDCGFGVTLQVFCEKRVSIADTFPDEQFRSYVSNEFDQNRDGYLSTDERLECLHISVSGRGITSLQGIEVFPKLISLSCPYNPALTELDLRHNTALDRLYCNNTNLTTLDLRQNQALSQLDCTNASLRALDLSGLTHLKYLYCEGNDLAMLKLAAEPLSYTINANPVILFDGVDPTLDLADLPGCATIDPAKISNVLGGTLNGTVVTFATPEAPFFIYTYDCGFGKTLKVSLAGGSAAGISLTDAFPDENFRSYVVTFFDTDSDGFLSIGERMAVTGMHIDAWVSSLKGIEFFPNLTSLICYNNQLTELDLRQNAALTELDCSGNQLRELDLSQNPALKKLNCANNQLRELDLRQNAALTELVCSHNPLYELDLSHNIALTSFSCSFSNLSKLDLSKNIALKSLICSDIALRELNISPNIALEELLCSNTQLAQLDVSQNPFLNYLDCSGTQLSELDLSQNPFLGYLNCFGTQLSELDLSQNPDLYELRCHDNQLTELDLSKNTALQSLYCYDNQLTELELGNKPILTNLNCTGNQLTELDLSSAPNLRDFRCVENRIPALTLISDLYTCQAASIIPVFLIDSQVDIASLPGGEAFDPTKVVSISGGTLNGTVLTFIDETVTYIYNCGSNQTMTVTLNANRIIIDEAVLPDTMFRSYVTNRFDTDHDGYLSISERNAVTEIEISRNHPMARTPSISSLQGIALFPNLSRLLCENNQLTELDVSQNSALTELYCSNNPLTELDLSRNPALTHLYCSSNQLRELDLSGCLNLQTLVCCETALPALTLYAAPTVCCEVSSTLNVIPVGNKVNLAALPGGEAFDPSKVVAISGGKIEGTTFTFTTGTAMYTYDCGFNQTMDVVLVKPATVSGHIVCNGAFAPLQVELWQENQLMYGLRANTDGELTFFLRDVAPGTYDLIVKREAHLTYTVKNLTVGTEDIDLTKLDKPYRTITLIAGDLNDDGLVNVDDLNIIWSAEHYNKPTPNAKPSQIDLNGDGFINADDLNIVWSSANYNKNAEQHCTYSAKP